MYKNGDKVYNKGDGSEWTITDIKKDFNGSYECLLINDKGEKLPMYLNILDEYGFTSSKENALTPINKIKNAIETAMSEDLGDDYDFCEDLFNLMSPENQQKFLNKYGYEDLGYAYDDNDELAYYLVNAMDEQETIKCKEGINKIFKGADSFYDDTYMHAGDTDWKYKEIDNDGNLIPA